MACGGTLSPSQTPSTPSPTIPSTCVPNFDCAGRCATGYKCCPRGGRCMPVADECGQLPYSCTGTCHSNYTCCQGLGQRCLKSDGSETCESCIEPFPCTSTSQPIIMKDLIYISSLDATTGLYSAPIWEMSQQMTTPQYIDVDAADISPVDGGLMDSSTWKVRQPDTSQDSMSAMLPL